MMTNELKNFIKDFSEETMAKAKTETKLNAIEALKRASKIITRHKTKCAEKFMLQVCDIKCSDDEEYFICPHHFKCITDAIEKYGIDNTEFDCENSCSCEVCWEEHINTIMKNAQKGQ